MLSIDNTIDLLREELIDADIDDFEIFARDEENLEAESKDLEVESFERSKQRGVAVRVIKDGRLGMTSTTNMTEDALKRIVAESLETMVGADPSDFSGVPQPQTQVSALAERAGRSLSEISDEEKIRAARNLEAAVREADPRIKRARDARYAESTVRSAVVNSRGIDENAQRGIVMCSVQAVAEDKGFSEVASESLHNVRFDELDVAAIGKRASERAVSLLGATQLKTGRYRIYLAPRAATAMLGVLMPQFFADNVQRHKSRLADRMGERAMSEIVTVVDDGLLPGGMGSFSFDAEGVASQRTVVVNKGEVSAWLYDVTSALRDGRQSTGNAYRSSVHSAPAISVTNSYIMGGRQTFAELVSSCEGGFWVSDLMGLHTANPVTGDFSLGATGYRIADGKAAEPVRGVTIAGNVLELFARIDGVADDLTFYGRYGAPSVTVSDVQVNGL